MRSDPVRLLLVDDDPQDRRLVRRAVESAFSDIEIVEVAEAAAFQRSLGEAFDIALIESQLLWIEGLKAFRLLHKKQPFLPVILITGTGDEESCARAMRSGVADYVVKNRSGYARLPRAIRLAITRGRKRHRKEIVATLTKRAFADVVARNRELEQLVKALKSTKTRDRSRT